MLLSAIIPSGNLRSAGNGSATDRPRPERAPSAPRAAGGTESGRGTQHRGAACLRIAQSVPLACGLRPTCEAPSPWEGRGSRPDRLGPRRLPTTAKIRPRPKSRRPNRECPYNVVACHGDAQLMSLEGLRRGPAGVNGIACGHRLASSPSPTANRERPAARRITPSGMRHVRLEHRP
jgi:hypothetical protein